MAITITESAKDKIRGLMSKHDAPNDYLFIGLKGGGCSGFRYHYEFMSSVNEKDRIFVFDDVKICIDAKSYIFLNGMQIDYEEDLLKSGLVFNTPGAKRSCGCGESISF